MLLPGASIFASDFDAYTCTAHSYEDVTLNCYSNIYEDSLALHVQSVIACVIIGH